MKNLLISTAAVVALAGAAHAQDAFITQVGDDNSAINYSEYNQSGNTNSDNMQVIVQEGNGFAAANFARGKNNSAFAYQQNPNGDPNATMESLIWQSAQNFNEGGNTAVAVQLNTNSPGTQSTFKSQIIQEGADNTAVNWAQNAGGAMAGISLANTSLPSISLNPAANPSPNPVLASTGFPFGTTVSIP